VYLTRPRIALSFDFGVRDAQPTKYKRGDRSFVLSPRICAVHKLNKNQLLPDALGKIHNLLQRVPSHFGSTEFNKSILGFLEVWVKVVADSQVAPDKRRFLISLRSDPARKQSVEFQLKLQRESRTRQLCGKPMVTASALNVRICRSMHLCKKSQK